MNGMGSLLINEKMQVALSKWDVISDIIGWVKQLINSNVKTENSLKVHLDLYVCMVC